MGSLVASAPAKAAEKFEFDIPAERLDRALTELARQGRVSISLDDARLQTVRTAPVMGRMTVSSALRRLLRGTGFDFRLLEGGIVRVFRRAPEPRRPRPRPAPAVRTVSPETEGPPIIVTASKQDKPFGEFAGSAHVASLSEAEGFRVGAKGTEFLLRDTPNLTSTELGPGRNKIFIRGIADSSFNGLSQATSSQYFGESHLIYSAPDPDLALYDVERIEVLEGPQGTLYGAGSLGGVIRVVPRSPDPSRFHVAAAAGLAVTGSEIGGDVAAVVNLPLGASVAVRAVGYRTRGAGYIDDDLRDKSDINRTKIDGGRLSIAFEPFPGFEAEGGVILQNIGSRDGQYTNVIQPALTRRSRISQPFDNDYRLAYLTAKTDIGGARLVSNTSFVWHAVDSEFDATQPDALLPRVFKDGLKVSLFTHETRLSGSGELFENWVAGLAVARNVNHSERSIGPPDDPSPISDVRSATLEAAVFGEASVEVLPRVSLTGGARVSYYRQIEELHADAMGDFEPLRKTWRLMPTAAISWQPWNGGIVYARYQQGYRPGAQRIVLEGPTVAVRQFDPDEIATREIGLRFGDKRSSRVNGSLSFAHSRWDDVQADLVTADGFPYVANLGSGFVRYVSASLGWSPIAGLHLEASGFHATSHLDRPAPEFESASERDLPNIADNGWRIAGSYSASLDDATLAVNGSVEAVGKSYLGIGSAFDRSQGDYLATSAGARLELGKWGISLDVDNLLDSRANTFSYGNPFSLAREDQRTPLRPRTFRVGIDAAF